MLKENKLVLLISTIVSLFFGIGYLLCVKYAQPELFAILLIIVVISICQIERISQWFNPKQRDNPLDEKSYAGWVCEQCGAPYNKCVHCKDEEYALIRKE